MRDVRLTSPGGTTLSPELAIAGLIGDALDPTKAHGKLRTMADMTPAELAALVPPRSRR